MVKFISSVVAILLTAIIAIALYPIAGVCWVFSQIGKVSVCLFNWTNKTIKKLWDDIVSSN